MNISNETEISDIAALKNLSAVKSSKNGLVYIYGNLFEQPVKNFAICENTNMFDICNSMMAQSPVSTNHERTQYTNEECSMLNDLEAAFND